MEERYKNINVSDEILVEGCRKHDRRTQELLYRKYARSMYYVCLSYTGNNKEVAKDILQDAFLKVYRNISKYSNTGPLEGWIRRIVSNTAIDFFRSNKKNGFSIPVEEVQHLSETGKDEVEISSGTEEIYSMIRDLPEGARVIFQLFAVEGYSHKEIAEKLDISESTSKSQFQRARKILKNRLNKNEVL